MTRPWIITVLCVVLWAATAAASSGIEIEIKPDAGDIPSKEATTGRGVVLEPELPAHGAFDHLFPPTEAEFNEATELLKKSSEFGALLKNQELVVYEAMPGAIDRNEINSSGKGRIVAVGLRPQGSTSKDLHEIVAVDLESKQIFRFAGKAPSSAIAAPTTCGIADSRQYSTGRWWAGRARINVDRSGERVWSMTVTRPSSSSGALGSAIDLTNVYYKGRLVLAQAHVPILNVNYAGNACGPYRDWQYAENPFQATGSDIVAGIRRTTTAPKTIFETNNDTGNFRGVAVYDDGDTMVLVSEISAAWYRYVSEFRFHTDGTIEPRFKFSAVDNSCVCYTHNHHVYWRFDFDIDTAANNSIQVYNGSTWRNVDKEESFYRNASARQWRVRNNQTGHGYTIIPGAHDGTANTYGRGDAWALRYRSGQIDDSRVRTSTQANLDAFNTEEPISSADVVFWYTGHFTHEHDGDDHNHDNAILGPVLKPF